MDNYYNELSQLELLKQELDKFADSLENNKEGCFKHRIEAFINILLNETQNQNYLRNKIQNYINEANYRGDVKSYVMQAFLSFFEPIEFNIPKSLINVVNKNKRVDSSMIEGYNNFKSANNYTQSQEPHKEALPPQPIDKEQNRTKNVIAATFENIDKNGWAYAFTSEQDYNLFTDLLTNFFEYKDYSIPETPIQLKRGCKTKVAKALGEIHKELSNENKLTTDTNYFNLVRVLSHFESEKQNDLYKALTR